MKDLKRVKINKVNWKYIVLFYVIAIGISVPFHLGIALPFYQSFTAGFMISKWGFIPACLGPLMAVAIITVLDRKQKRTITFFGNNTFKNILIAIAPLVVFAGVGIENEMNKNAHYFAFAFAGVSLLYGIAEEIAWRGYLLDALRPLHKNIRILLIGIMWWAWHIRFGTSFDWTVFLLICLGGTVFLIKFTDDTKSYLCAAGLHSLIIITTNGDTGPFNNTKIMATVLVVIVWLAIGKVFGKKVIMSDTHDI